MNNITYIKHRLLAAGLALALPGAQAEPWRLADSVPLPEWASLSGSFRVRYEHLDGQYRAGGTGSDQILVLRTLLHGALRAGDFTLGAELEDSRQALADRGTPLSASVVNSAELLQAYLEWRAAGLFGDAKSMLKIGRQTMDVGKRRLVARNRFRNTLNAFSGADWQLDFAGGQQLRAFFVLPVRRLPGDFPSLRDNDAHLDDEDGNVRFWGLFGSAEAPWDGRLEVYLLGLNEDDSHQRATRNRDIRTLGARWYRQPVPERLDYELESVIQWGESRSSTSSTLDLDHFAYFQHAELGYSFAHPWQPRLVVQFDYASGDEDPNDGDNDRFDTLFGARRFDFGPTGIYGPFARSNLVTPGVRVQLKPAPRLSGFLAYRAFWLASARDAWTTARMVDAAGRSGSFLGQQLEGRLRWDPIARNVRIETGAAYLAEGSFADDAPNANPEGDSAYFYVQTVLSF